MEITESQVAEFRQTGYLPVPQLFTAREVAAMRAELDRLRAAGLLRNVTTDGDGKTHSTTRRNLQLCPMYRHSDLFRALPFDARVTAAVSRLLGDPVVLRLDQVFLKPAGDGSGTNWHQDNAYFKILDPLKGTAMWIAVHDANAANGGLQVIPGSFDTPLEHVRDPESDHHIRCYPPEERAVTVELPAGGVVFFCYGTPHCTGANTTDCDRAGVAYHFVHASCFHQDPAIRRDSLEGYYPVLTGPEATSGLREYGESMSGRWEVEVERALELAQRRASG